MARSQDMAANGNERGRLEREAGIRTISVPEGGYETDNPCVVMFRGRGSVGMGMDRGKSKIDVSVFQLNT